MAHWLDYGRTGHLEIACYFRQRPPPDYGRTGHLETAVS